MRNCNSCQKELLENAKFCHHCGAKVLEVTLDCPQCGAENDQDSKFCFLCGFDFFVKEAEEPIEKQEPEVHDIFEANPNENIEEELVALFTEAFKKRIEEEHNNTKFEDYAKRFNESDFKISFEFRVKQLAEEIEKIQIRNKNPEVEKKALLDRAFEDLLDYFIIRFCVDFNEIDLPETILKYQNIKPQDIDKAQMILDYLDFDKEDEIVYTDFLKMPFDKLKNAGQSFLFPEKEEKILFICDQSLMGSCKEGFALTEKGIYWKAHFEKAEKVLYHDLTEIKRQEDWITINGHFFNVNKSINLKLLKLLKRLRDC